MNIQMAKKKKKITCTKFMQMNILIPKIYVCVCVALSDMCRQQHKNNKKK